MEIAQTTSPGTARYGSRASLLLVLRVLRLDAERDGGKRPRGLLCATRPSTMIQAGHDRDMPCLAEESMPCCLLRLVPISEAAVHTGEKPV